MATFKYDNLLCAGSVYFDVLKTSWIENTSGTVTLRANTDSGGINIIGGTGGITIDATMGDGSSGDVAGTVGVVSKGSSSWTNTSGNLSLSTVTSGTLSISSAAAATIASTTTMGITSTGSSSWTNTSGNLSISTATSGTLTLNSAAAMSIASSATSLSIGQSGVNAAFSGGIEVDEASTFSSTLGVTGTLTAGSFSLSGTDAGAGGGSWSAGSYSASAWTDGAFSISGGLNITNSNFQIRGDGSADALNKPIIDVRQEATDGGRVARFTQVNGGESIFEINSISTADGSFTDVTKAIVAAPGNTNITGAQIAAYFRVMITDNSAETGTNKLTSGHYYIPVYELTV